MRGLTALSMLVALVIEYGNGLALNGVRRVIGGQEYPRGKFGFSVLFWESPDSKYCAGSLLNANWVLTADECFAFWDYPENVDWTVAVGMHNQTNPEDSFQTRKISSISRSYTIRWKIPKMAMFRLNESVDLTDSRVATIDYNRDGNCPIVGQRCKVISRGWTEKGYPDVPRVAFVKILEKGACNETIDRMDSKYFHGDFGSSFICTGFPDGEICHGKYGSPLLCKCNTSSKNDDEDLFDDQGYVVVGVSLFGIACILYDPPRIFTRVSPFTDFISKMIASNP